MNFKEALIAHLQGELVEVKTFGKWESIVEWASKGRAPLTAALADDSFATACEFRLAPRTIMCNGVEVPAPERVAPNEGEYYFIPSISNCDPYFAYRWHSTIDDYRCLSKDLVYLTKEDAIARAKAMLIVQEVK